MQFQTVKLKGGAEVHVDFDERMAKCRGCSEMIRFGVTKNGVKMPIREIEPNVWASHFADCKQASRFRGGLQEKVDESDRNQEYLSNL
jgi:hypothetical protein